MNRTLVLGLAAVSLAATAILGSVYTAEASAPNSYVLLQAASPGTAQNGNIRINGKFTGAITQDGAAAITLTANGSDVNGMVVNAAGTNATGIVANASGFGLYGTGGVAGVCGASSSGPGVLGSGSTYGVHGQVSGSSAAGVFGEHLSNGSGVEGHSSSGTGVFGQSQYLGVRGFCTTSGAGGAGIYGSSIGINGSVGVSGTVFSSSAYAVAGSNNYGHAVVGFSNASLYSGVVGQNPLGVGVSGNGTRGLYGVGSSSDGVYGTTGAGNAAGVSGVNTGGGYGVYASSGTGFGVQGSSGGYAGVAGVSSTNGLYGNTNNAGASGCYGTNGGGGWGVYGSAVGAGIGTAGWNTDPAGYGLYSYGQFAATGLKSFQIDYPFDPENKYLNHFCTEGPEPQNVYGGTVRTDEKGFAIVALPDYFAEINTNPRVQLTVVDDSDAFVLVKVVRKVENCEFTLRTSKPRVEVFWRVEATRNDRWVREHGYKDVQEKPAQFRGKYLNPELYGKPAEQGQAHMTPAPAVHLHPSEAQPNLQLRPPAPLLKAGRK